MSLRDFCILLRKTGILWGAHKTEGKVTAFTLDEYARLSPEQADEWKLCTSLHEARDATKQMKQHEADLDKLFGGKAHGN